MGKSHFLYGGLVSPLIHLNKQIFSFQCCWSKSCPLESFDALLGLLLHLPCVRRLDLGKIRYSEFASQLNFSLRGKKTSKNIPTHFGCRYSNQGRQVSAMFERVCRHLCHICVFIVHYSPSSLPDSPPAQKSKYKNENEKI